MADPILHGAWLWENGMVMAFDEDGEQIPELQGQATPELFERLRAHSTPDTNWTGFGEDGPAQWPSPENWQATS